MDNITHLPNSSVAGMHELLILLEDITNKVKIGEVVSLAIVCERKDGSVFWHWPSVGSVHRIGHGMHLMLSNYTDVVLKVNVEC